MNFATVIRRRGNDELLQSPKRTRFPDTKSQQNPRLAAHITMYHENDPILRLYSQCHKRQIWAEFHIFNARYRSNCWLGFLTLKHRGNYWHFTFDGPGKTKTVVKQALAQRAMDWFNENASKPDSTSIPAVENGYGMSNSSFDGNIVQ